MVLGPRRLWQTSKPRQLRTQETALARVLLNDYIDRQARPSLAQGRMQGALRWAEGGFSTPYALQEVNAPVNSAAAGGLYHCPSTRRFGFPKKLQDSICWEEGFLAYHCFVKPKTLCSVQLLAKVDPPPPARIVSAIIGEVVSSLQKDQPGPGNQVRYRCHEHPQLLQPREVYIHVPF